MKNVIAFFIPIALAFSACQTTNRRPQSVDDDQEFRAELRAALLPSVKTLNRMVHVYHYGRRSPGLLDLKRKNSYSSPVELEPKEARDYFTTWSSQFAREADLGTSEVGPGLYAAIDPVQSEVYAREPWFLMEIEVPKGASYLRLSPGFDVVPLPEAFVRRWFSGPDPSLSQALARGAGMIFLLNSNRGKAFRQVLMDLHVDFIAYKWDPSGLGICDPKGLTGGDALNLINPELLKEGARLRVFVADLEEGASSKKKDEYARVYRKIANARGLRFNETAAPVEWYPSSFAIRTRTVAWSRTLGSPSFLDRILAKTEDVEKIVGTYAHQEMFFNQTLKVQMNESAFPKSTNTSFYDPLAEGEIPVVGNRDEVIAEIRGDTFGCSEDYPDER